MGLHLRDHFFQLRAIHVIHDGMRQHGCSACFYNIVHRIHRRDLGAADVAAAALADVLRKRGFNVRDITLVQQIARNVGAGDDRVGEHGLQCFQRNVEPLAAQLFQHVDIAVVPGIAEICHVLLKRFICDINVKSENMNLFSFIFGGQFHAGNQLDAGFLRSHCRLRNAICRVVVGEGEGAKPGLFRLRHKLGRRECAVGCV